MAKLGEVVEAGTASFVGQCYELHQPPALGSLVKTHDPPVEIYGVVCSAETRSLDEGRHPVARGAAAESEQDVFRSHPQLARLLCTEVRALVVGHAVDGRVLHCLPPRPARIHGFIHYCEAPEAREFSRSPAFLRLLLAEAGLPWIDEVVAACLRRFGEVHEDAEGFLVSGARELARLIDGDFHRLERILKRVRVQ